MARSANAELPVPTPVGSGDTLTLSWNGGPGIKLQKTTSLANPSWQDVAGSDGVSQITVPCEYGSVDRQIWG